MSLFKAREWWSTKCGSGEMFDHGLLAVGNLDNSNSGTGNIVVGSFQGYIRIFEPHPPGYSAGHVILEKELGMPIIQLTMGKFLANSEQVCLCVLSPHRLAILGVIKDTDGTTAPTNEGAGLGAEPSYTLVSLHTHQLHRTAANMSTGFFDTQNSVEQVCVQSMDGQLSFFTPSSHAFSCFLPDFLLPGPLEYLPLTNTIITSNSAHQLLFFRYQSLAVAASRTESKERSSTGRKLTPERVVNLGEHIVQIQVIRDNSNSANILVLGERSMYCLNQNGVVVFMKKLEVGAACVWAYDTVPAQQPLNGGDIVKGAGPQGGGVKAGKDHHTAASERGVVRSMLVTYSGQLLVLQDDALVWTATLPHTPVHITTANFSELCGVIVSVDIEGRLLCSYLGTDPTLFTATPIMGGARTHNNYEEMEKELSAINKSIKTSKSDLSMTMSHSVQVQLNAVCDPNLVRIVEVDNEPEEAEVSGGRLGNKEEEESGEDKSYRPVKKCVEVQVLVKCEGGGTIKNMTVNVNAALPLTTHPTHFHLNEVTSSNAPDALIVTVVCTPSLLPVHNSLTLSATYTTQLGLVEVIECEVRLPVQLFCEPAYPEKTGLYKVTVDASPCEGNLAKLFPSVLVLPEAPPHALGLRYLCGPVVTVVASKTATQRYRLQSDSLSAIGATLVWLLHRLQAYYKGASPPFTARFTPPLPLTEYFEILERHYKRLFARILLEVLIFLDMETSIKRLNQKNALSSEDVNGARDCVHVVRVDLEQCYEWLSRHAHQFRAIQKRLLTRFKDKTPVGLAHLDTLLDGTYMQLNALIDKGEGLELELQAVTNDLICSTLLIITLLRMSANLSEEDSAILTATLCPHVSMDTTDQGWEEQVDAAVVHLLQTSLSKSSREQNATAPPLSLNVTPDCQKLKKHIALLCDRILRGYRPSGPRLEVTQSLNGAKSVSYPEVSPVVMDPPPVTASLSKDPLAAAPVNATAPYRKHPVLDRKLSMPALQEHVGEGGVS